MRRCLWREDGDAAREIQGLTSGRETEVWASERFFSFDFSLKLSCWYLLGFYWPWSFSALHWLSWAGRVVVVLTKMLSSRSRCSVLVAVSAVSSQDGLVHFDSQCAGLFHSGSSLGRRRRVDWLDGSYCIDVGWSQSCVMGLIRTFPSLTLLRQLWLLCQWWACLFCTASLLGLRRCVAWSVSVVMLIAVGLVFVVLVGSSSSLTLWFTSRGCEYTD